MLKKTLLTQRMIIVLACMLVGGGAVFAALIYFFVYQPPQFSAYRTSLELNGSSVKKEELYYTDVDKFVKLGTAYTQTYSSGVVVGQSRFDGWRPENCSWYNTRLFIEYETECNHYALKGDDAYRIVIRRQGDRIVSFFASAKLGNTDMHVHIPEDQYDGFVDYQDWEKYFSSLRPKSLLFTPREYKPTPAEF